MQHNNTVQAYFKEYYLNLAEQIQASGASVQFIEKNYHRICQGKCYVPWTKAEKERAAKKGIFL